MEPSRLVALVTCPTQQARVIADRLVTDRLAACVNIVPAVQSVYRWEGEINHDEEALLVVKTTADRVAQIDRLLVEIHPYEMFELIALPIEDGAGSYLDWIVAQTR